MSPSSLLVRRRVPLGFACAVAAFWFASPTLASIGIGLLVALPGEALRVWAAGHLDKGREITTSGPYRFIRHPLYVGSAILGAGFMAASASWISALVAGGYLALTLTAAMRAEEQALDERFSGGYARYREGRAELTWRTFSLARVRANREHRAMAGFVAGFLLLLLKVMYVT